MITTGGIIIQLRVQDISILGRITSGVKMINLDEGIKVASIAKVREKIIEQNNENEELTEETVIPGEEMIENPDDNSSEE